MFKLRVRCYSKNSGEVFYEYDTKVLHDIDSLKQKFNVFVDAFLLYYQFHIEEDCSFDVSVLRVKEELSLFDDFSDILDFNKTPVVF